MSMFKADNLPWIRFGSGEVQLLRSAQSPNAGNPEDTSRLECSRYIPIFGVNNQKLSSNETINKRLPAYIGPCRVCLRKREI